MKPYNHLLLRHGQAEWDVSEKFRKECIHGMYQRRSRVVVHMLARGLPIGQTLGLGFCG